MKWSYRIARIAGIDVRIHTTFLLLLAFIAWANYQGGGAAAAIEGVIFISLLFLCVLLHEFGHALAARRFGIRTPDITLLPIGGVARLERMPDTPIQELIVAIAGPAVNVVIAAILWIALGGPSNWRDFLEIDTAGPGLLSQLLAVNVMLILFNLIPAFPMDGGRVLRALLATRIDHSLATQIAARIGQGIAICFAVAGFFGNPFLIFIAMFVFMGAEQEASFAKLKAATAGLRVRDAMIARFDTFPDGMLIGRAVEDVLRDTQPVYPVTDSALRVIGMASRADLLAAAGDPTRTVASVAQVTPAVTADATFDDAFQQMYQSGIPVLPVVNPAGQIVGLVSLNLLRERSRVMPSPARASA